MCSRLRRRARASSTLLCLGDCFSLFSVLWFVDFFSSYYCFLLAGRGNDKLSFFSFVCVFCLWRVGAFFSSFSSRLSGEDHPHLWALRQRQACQHPTPSGYGSDHKSTLQPNPQRTAAAFPTHTLSLLILTMTLRCNPEQPQPSILCRAGSRLRLVEEPPAVGGVGDFLRQDDAFDGLGAHPRLSGWSRDQRRVRDHPM